MRLMEALQLCLAELQGGLNSLASSNKQIYKPLATVC